MQRASIGLCDGKLAMVVNQEGVWVKIHHVGEILEKLGVLEFYENRNRNTNGKSLSIPKEQVVHVLENYFFDK